MKIYEVIELIRIEQSNLQIMWDKIVSPDIPFDVKVTTLMLLTAKAEVLNHLLVEILRRENAPNDRTRRND